METIFTFDWENVLPKVIEGLKTGTVTIRDGVAYWAEGSGNTGIVQHMPLKELSFDPKKITELVELTKAAHATQLAAIGLSTGIIVGAIIIQTIYLSKKIDKLQEKIDIMSQDINSQNVIYFMGKISEYFGVVESARILLLDKELVGETIEISNILITELSIKRNEVMSLVDNMIGYAHNLTDKHLSHMLDFINLMFSLLPKAIYIESQLCDRYGKFRLANHLIKEGEIKYNNSLDEYRCWSNKQVKKAICGSSEPIAICFHEKRDALKEIFSSKENPELLYQLVMPKLTEQREHRVEVTSPALTSDCG